MFAASTLVSVGSLLLAACGGARATPVIADAPSVAAPAEGQTPGAGERVGVPSLRQDPQQERGAPNAGLLRRFAAQKLIVLPLQGVAASDPLGWRQASGGDRVLMASLDAGVEAAMGERGLGALWVFPPALQRAARRNPTYVTDPATIQARDAVRAATRKTDDPLAEPFASQLRSLAGVSDARYAFIPLELRFEPLPNATTGRAVLQVAVVDARGSRVVWVGEAAGDPHPTYTSAALASLARRVADLVVPRP